MSQSVVSLGSKLAGRYRIVRSLGEGGFGETFIAEDEHLPNAFQCVVKRLKTGVADPSKLPIATRLFDSEAKVLHQLGGHDQIPQLLAHFAENGEFYLVEDFVEGHSLCEELPAGQIKDEAYVLDLLQAILGVLAFVHQRQVVHRDIKPSNLIRRRSDGKIVLIDFGAVKQLSTQVIEANANTPHTVVVGTPGYVPSEQMRGNPRPSSDVYAVGVIAIQALTGLNPALGELPEDETTGELQWHDHAQVSPELAAIIDKMVLYDFRQRYVHAGQALEAVQALVAKRHTRAGIPTEVVTQEQLPLTPDGRVTVNPSPPSPAAVPRPSLEPTQVVAPATTSAKPPRNSLKIAALGGIALVALGGFLGVASPRISPLCQVLDNCTPEIKVQTMYDEAVAQAEAALSSIQDATSLDQLTQAQAQVRAAIEDMDRIPHIFAVHTTAQQALPAYRAKLQDLEARIAQEKQAAEALQAAESLAQSLQEPLANATTIAALEARQSKGEQALQTLEQVSEQSLLAAQAQTQRQTINQQLQAVASEIAKLRAAQTAPAPAAPQPAPPSAPAPSQARVEPAPPPAYSEPSYAPPSYAEPPPAYNPPPRQEPLWEAPPPAAPAQEPLWDSPGSSSSGSGEALW